MAKTASQRGYGAAWRRIRERILKRDKGLCRSCAAIGLIRQATEVDHIVRKKDGGTDNDNNLQSLCSTCHKDKTRAENAGRAVVRSGCTADGIPIDPNHHWGGGTSISGG